METKRLDREKIGVEIQEDYLIATISFTVKFLKKKLMSVKIAISHLLHKTTLEKPL